ncbi:uncharacterized protein DUF4382 [Roseivirga pacifica]|uniref:DUF4382 domain-containing protein n=1 Tax=Roseivirga pacifica TaxID=1267423 RepID=A0A1I0MT65_9BACT|nr:DUF4382 domain-containing protein [Roseivirga pacifica]RKQ50677.1 uncharacterized protein DUF4382 [Roseivirga pacifica]SEV91852.1 protein of unknown function [Roseivirga pacifica]
MKNFKTLIATLFIGTGLITMSCDDDNNNNEMSGQGSARIEATDAAVDAENVSGVFLSVDEVQVIANGEVENSIMFDEPEVFDIMAYQNGETYFMGEVDLDAGAYDQVRLMLTSGAEAFIEFTDGTTQEIDVPSGSQSGYKINGEFEVLANGVSEVVLDVDLRKALVMTGNGEYKLRPTARLIGKSESGTIMGSVDVSQMSADSKTVVYAYAEGSYSDSEMGEPAEGSARFEGSVNSATVDASGNFTLAFMPEGDYEIIVASYEEDPMDEDGFTFTSATKVEVEINGSLLDIFSVEARSTTNLIIDLF